MEKQKIVDYIKNERKRQGISMRDLAEKSGVRAATICEFENKGSGTLKTFMAIIDGLGLDIQVGKKYKV